MGFIRYKQKKENILKLMKYLKHKNVEINEHEKQRDK